MAILTFIYTYTGLDFKKWNNKVEIVSEKNAFCHLCTQYPIMKWTITEKESVEMGTNALIVIMVSPLFEMLNPLF